MNLLRTIVVIMNDNYVRNGTSHNERHNNDIIGIDFIQMHFFFFLNMLDDILIFLLVLYF